ncbi:MAG: hypothetical protein NTZ56_20245 [Acidobacteria bacterium]|nr:hypothetical protein [Acidobacteriota bacterium]
MAEEPVAPAGPGSVGPDADWPRNYFNYFTEIEEQFRQARGTGFFLLSPLDWALIETWQKSGVPLQAALQGIDSAFEKWRSKKQRTQAVNSLAYCAQAVLKAAEDLARGETGNKAEVAPPFPIEALREYLEQSAKAIAGAGKGYLPVAAVLERLALEVELHFVDLEGLEQRLTALEEKMLATARLEMSDDAHLAARQELDRQLRPYRGKMTAEQLALVERQFLDRRLLENKGLRRLSLFYLGS